jgi:hypothetical protein
MRGKLSLVVSLLALAVVFAPTLRAQAWSGIVPAARATDWSSSGVPGGIPARTTVCATVAASTFGNGSSDATSGIQSALSSCASGQVVMLSAGTFLINGNLSIPANVSLRGAGANQTVLNSKTTSNAPVNMGAINPNFANATSITGGNSAGSTSITVKSASGITVGSYLVIDQQNDGKIVTNAGSEGTCTWCDGGQANGTYSQGQIAEVTSVNGTTIGINPPLYVSYTLAPLATPFTMIKNAGLENLQIFANNTHSNGNYSNIVISGCAYCWISGVEGNYTDGDHVDIYWGYHDSVVNNYFSNSYLHQPGTYDSNVDLIDKTTATLVQNNIFERLHTAIMLEWGAAGNVVSYNYVLGGFDSGAPNAMMQDIDLHGAHPQFNLFEGNVATTYGADNIWGSAANNTYFRNNPTGTTKVCNPLTGRGNVVCSVLGEFGLSGITAWLPFQGARAVNPTYETTNPNFVGNVVGTAGFMQLLAYANVAPNFIAHVSQVVAVCGPSPCGSGSRSYDAAVYSYSYGYGEDSDDGSSGFDSSVPYTTRFLHGDYDVASNAITWASGVTQTLPPSFYLSAKPAWWGNTPYPAIGPDVTGGPGPAGHTYLIPAQVCYQSVMNGTDGTGSPMTFNAGSCYPTGAANPAPAPPTNLTAVAG